MRICKKAEWYLNHLINHISRRANEHFQFNRYYLYGIAASAKQHSPEILIVGGIIVASARWCWLAGRF